MGSRGWGDSSIPSLDPEETFWDPGESSGNTPLCPPHASHQLLSQEGSDSLPYILALIHPAPTTSSFQKSWLSNPLSIPGRLVWGSLWSLFLDLLFLHYFPPISPNLCCCCFIIGPYLAMLRIYSWLSTQELLLEVLRDHMRCWGFNPGGSCVRLYYHSWSEPNFLYTPTHGLHQQPSAPESHSALLKLCHGSDIRAGSGIT